MCVCVSLVAHCVQVSSRMELTGAVVSFHALLCSVWAISHHSSISSPLSDPSGKMGRTHVTIATACRGCIVLAITQTVSPPPPAFSFGAVERAVPVRALLSDVAPSAPSLPTSTSSVEARRHRERLHTLVHACTRSQSQPLFETVFSDRLKESWSLFQPGLDQDQSEGHRCLQGPPGPPGPQGPEVSLAEVI